MKIFNLHGVLRPLHRSAAALLTTAFCLAVSNLAVAVVDDAAAEKLLRHSGVWSQTDALSAAVAAGFGNAHLQPGSTLTEQDGKRLGQLASRVFIGSNVRAEMVRSVAGALTPNDVRAVEAWYSSKLGRRITALEERASLAQADIEATKAKASAAFSEASETRQQQVKALDEAVRASEQTSSMVLNMALAVAYGVAKAPIPHC